MYLPGATEFTDDYTLCSPVELLRLLRTTRAHRRIWQRMIAEAGMIEGGGGRPRKPGCWLLLYLAYVLTGEPGVERFYTRYVQNGHELCGLAGFDELPSQQNLQLRFAELEHPLVVRAVEDATAALFQLAHAQEPRIGRIFHVDATGFQAHVRLHHDCPDPRLCGELVASRKAKRGAAVLELASDELIESRRHEEQAGPEPGPREAPADAVAPELPRSGRERYPVYFWIRGHRYGCVDASVGVRSYSNKEKRHSWVGGYDLVAIDDFTGGRTVSFAFPANKQEFKAYPALLRKLIRSTGFRPEAISGDRGISVTSVFRLNTRLGIASVIPFRRPAAGMERGDLRTDAYDEHGVPRCAHCGSPGSVSGRRLGFTFQNGRPIIRFRCVSAAFKPSTPECASIQSIACERSWRLLLPISRLDERYHAIRKSHQNYERSFHQARARYSVAGSDVSGRLKRHGIAAHQLRGSAACFLDWYRICLRHGWLPGHACRNTFAPVVRRNLVGQHALLNKRRRYGLDLPYGAAAEKLGSSAAGSRPPVKLDDPAKNSPKAASQRAARPRRRSRRSAPTIHMPTR